LTFRENLSQKMSTPIFFPSGKVAILKNNPFTTWQNSAKFMSSADGFRPIYGWVHAGSQIGPKFDAPTESHFACLRIIFLKSDLRAMQLRDCTDLVYHLDQGISSI